MMNTEIHPSVRIDIDLAIHNAKMENDPVYRELAKRMFETIYQKVGLWTYR